MKRFPVWRYVLAAALALVFLLPFYMIVRNAFSTDAGFTSPHFHWAGDLFTDPSQPWYANLASVFTNQSVNLAGSQLNSVVVSVLQTLGTVVVSMLAAYGLARYDGRASRILLGLTLFTLMVPAAVTFIPTYIMTARLQWIDSYQGLVVPPMFSALATYLFRSHFLGFPHELEEAARLDGANPWQVFWRIVFPNSGGIIAAVGTITFMGSWNAFLWPMLVARDDTRTLQVSLSRFMTSQGVEYPELFTGAMISLIPVLIVFVVLQRWLVQGMELSGMSS